MSYVPGNPVLANAAHILRCSLRKVSDAHQCGSSFSSAFGVNVTQLIKSAHQAEKFEFTVSIAGSFEQIKLARSQSIHVMTDAMTTAAIDFQIELRDTIIYHLSKLRSDLARQHLSNPPRNRSFSALSHHKNAKNAPARRKTNHRH